MTQALAAVPLALRLSQHFSASATPTHFLFTTRTRSGRAMLARALPENAPFSAQAAAWTDPHLRRDLHTSAQGPDSHLHRDSPTSMPGLAHICAGTGLYLRRRDLHTSAPGLDHICTRTSTHLRRDHICTRTCTHLHRDWQFAPADVPVAVAGFLDHWRPALGIFVESELWPNLVFAARASRGLRCQCVARPLRSLRHIVNDSSVTHDPPAHSYSIRSGLPDNGGLSCRSPRDTPQDEYSQ